MSRATGAAFAASKTPDLFDDPLGDALQLAAQSAYVERRPFNVWYLEHVDRYVVLPDGTKPAGRRVSVQVAHVLRHDAVEVRA